MSFGRSVRKKCPVIRFIFYVIIEAELEFFCSCGHAVPKKMSGRRPKPRGSDSRIFVKLCFEASTLGVRLDRGGQIQDQESKEWASLRHRITSAPRARRGWARPREENISPLYPDAADEAAGRRTRSRPLPFPAALRRCRPPDVPSQPLAVYGAGARMVWVRPILPSTRPTRLRTAPFRGGLGFRV